MRTQIINIGRENATLEFENGVITEVRDGMCDQTIDAGGNCVLPGLIDCHTHLVFAGSRLDEFKLRAQGATYEQIMKAGGGIRSTMQATRAASEEELIALALPRLARMLTNGVTTIEAKSGYGLDVATELKILRVMKRLNQIQPVQIEPTFLGAHALPPEFKDKPDAYVDLVINEVMPQIVADKLARFVDVFVERGAFTPAQARRLLSAAQEMGLSTKLHAEQLSHQGGAKLAAELGAVSASHLEHVNSQDIEALKNSGVIAEILPLAQLYLNLQKIPAKQLADAGVLIAIGTDFNPGSAMCHDLLWAMRLAVSQCGLTCEQVLAGVTTNAAKSLKLTDIGTVQFGGRADLCLLSCQDPAQMMYDWSSDPVRTVIKNGQIVFDRERGFLGLSPEKT